MIRTMLCFFLLSSSCYREPLRHADQTRDREFQAHLRSAGFTGPDSAWLLKESDLLRTEDGGASWLRVSGKPVGTIRDAYFVDSNRGWAINDKGQVWTSSTRGESWVKMAELGDKWPIGSIRFVDESHGWIVGGVSVWRTENGGRDWNNIVTYGASDGIKAQTSWGYFLDDKLGWACGTKGVLFQTGDGGQTWQARRVLEEGREAAAVFFIDAQTGWLCDRPGSLIYRTDDGGKAWTKQNVPSQNLYLKSIHFVNKDEGWAAGTDREPGAITSDRIWGVVLHTTNGGRTWQFAKTEKRELFYTDIYFYDAQKGWLVARDNLYRTEDGGNTWSVVLSPSSDLKLEAPK